MANRILTRKEKQLERLEDELEETPFAEKSTRRRIARRIERLEDEIDSLIQQEESSSKNGDTDEDDDVEVIVVRGRDNVAKLLKRMGIEEGEETEETEGEEEEELEEEEGEEKPKGRIKKDEEPPPGHRYFRELRRREA